MGHSGVVGQVVDGDDFQVGKGRVQIPRPKKCPADPAEAVDPDPDAHIRSPLPIVTEKDEDGQLSIFLCAA
jgi:hypothetical protein